MNPTRRVEKPWGYELIWAVTDRYVGKILHIRAGEALSLQYHRLKDECVYVASGEMVMEVGEADRPLEHRTLRTGDSLHIYPGLRHRMTAVSDCDIFEVSTPELDDVVRLEDRYGRAPVGDTKR
jgi:mannose-6-phosphate isomerase-like protein (cupin superfamily)